MISFRKLVIAIANILVLSSLFGCSYGLVGDGFADVIHLSVRSRPAGADVTWRISSKTTEVVGGNRLYLGATPHRKTRSIRIPGLTKENAHLVTIVLELEKPGYNPVIEHFNMAGVLSHPNINVMYHLFPLSGRKDKSKVVRKSKSGQRIPAPLNVKVSSGETNPNITLSWSSVKGALRYEVYRDIRSNGRFVQRVGIVRGISFMDRSIRPGGVYYYRVRGIGASGAGAFSHPVKGSVKISINTKSVRNKLSIGRGLSRLKKVSAVSAVKNPPPKIIERDRFEPNDEAGKAGVMRLNRPYSGTIHNSKDRDYYKIFLNDTVVYQVKLIPHERKGKYRVEVLDSVMRVIFQAESSDVSVNLRIRLKEKGMKGGVYLIRVSGESNVVGAYDLRVNQEQ